MGAAPSQPAQSTQEQEANKRTMFDFEQGMVQAQQDFDRCEANLKSYEERPPNCPSIDTNALRNHISSQIHNDFQFNFTMSEGTKYSAERINDESIVNDVNNFLSGKAYQISNLDSKNPSPGYVTKEECRKISELFPVAMSLPFSMDQGDPNLGSENHICAIRQIQNSDDATFSNNVFWVPNPEMLPTRIRNCYLNRERCQGLEKHVEWLGTQCPNTSNPNEDNKIFCDVLNYVKGTEDPIPEDPTAEDPIPEDPTPEDPTAEETPPENPIADPISVGSNRDDLINDCGDVSACKALADEYYSKCMQKSASACKVLADNEEYYNHIVSACEGVKIDKDNQILCQIVFNKVKEIVSPPQDNDKFGLQYTSETQDILARKEPPLKGW